MKKIHSKIMTLVAVLAIMLALWYQILAIIAGRRAEGKKQELEELKQLYNEESLTDMITKHNAIINWRNEVINWKYDFDIKDNDLFSPTYTTDVEKALIRNDRQPIMFFAAVIDVSKETNQYLVHFNNCFDLFSRSADIHFILDCTPKQTKEILRHRANRFEKYAVISEVKKVKLKLTTDPLEQSNAFIAEGRCLDLLFVGNYSPRDSFMEKLKLIKNK